MFNLDDPTKYITNPIPLKSIADYLALKHKYVNPRRSLGAMRVVFRGHGNDRFELLPSFFRIKARPSDALSWSKFEARLLERFEKLSKPYIVNEPDGVLEWMALAQHHGLPTRLLDWTESFLVAAFFAVEDESFDHVPAAIWAFSGFVMKDRNITKWEHLEEALLTRENNIYFPRHNAQRIIAQQSCFTIHNYASEESKPLSLETQALRGAKSLLLSKFIIPINCKAKIREELNNLGINHFSIFPDLDGLSLRFRKEIKLSENDGVEWGI